MYGIYVLVCFVNLTTFQHRIKLIWDNHRYQNSTNMLKTVPFFKFVSELSQLEVQRIQQRDSPLYVHDCCKRNVNKNKYVISVYVYSAYIVCTILILSYYTGELNEVYVLLTLQPLYILLRCNYYTVTREVCNSLRLYTHTRARARARTTYLRALLLSTVLQIHYHCRVTCCTLNSELPFLMSCNSLSIYSIWNKNVSQVRCSQLQKLLLKVN